MEHSASAGPPKARGPRPVPIWPIGKTGLGQDARPKKNGEMRQKPKINGEMRRKAKKKWGDEKGDGKKRGDETQNEKKMGR